MLPGRFLKMPHRLPLLSAAGVGIGASLLAASLANGAPDSSKANPAAKVSAAKAPPAKAPPAKAPPAKAVVKAPAKTSAPTWSRDIAPIMFNNCASCHRPGEVAPFPLLSYADAKKHARQIALVTQTRFMPPWKAVPGHGDFTDENRLSDAQLATIQKWVEAGAPEGDPKAAPSAPQFKPGWQLGEPDAVLQAEEDFALAADGDDVYRCFVVPTSYSEDRYISAMEVRPGNRGVVHHVIAYIDTRGAARRRDEADPGPGYTSFGGPGFVPAGTLGGWAPGNAPHHLPAGTGILLPKGADVVLQVHYHKSGKAETDRTRVGVHFTEGPVDKRVRFLMVINPFLRIPAGDASHLVRAERTLPADITVLAVMPHMHLLGREMTVTAKLPEGDEKKMVKVEDWDFNWQMSYTFKEPLKLPKGSRIDVEARYDNSTNNPRNPSNPPRDVTWGEQTTDEMCIAFMPYTVDAEHLTQGQTVNTPLGGLGDFG